MSNHPQTYKCKASRLAGQTAWRDTVHVAEPKTESGKLNFRLKAGEQAATASLLNHHGYDSNILLKLSASKWNQRLARQYQKMNNTSIQNNQWKRGKIPIASITHMDPDFVLCPFLLCNVMQFPCLTSCAVCLELELRHAVLHEKRVDSAFLGNTLAKHWVLVFMWGPTQQKCYDYAKFASVAMKSTWMISDVGLAEPDLWKTLNDNIVSCPSFMLCKCGHSCQ